MSEELKPCSFCGLAALVDGDFGMESLSCSDRLAECPGSYLPIPCHTTQHRAGAIAAWNRRADSVTPPAPEGNSAAPSVVEPVAGAFGCSLEAEGSPACHSWCGDLNKCVRAEPVEWISDKAFEEMWAIAIEMSTLNSRSARLNFGGIVAQHVVDRAHPHRAPLSVNAAVKTLVDALIESKGWMRSYADALIRSAIDRDKELPRALMTDAEITSIWRRSVKAAELDNDFPHIFARAILAASGAAK